MTYTNLPAVTSQTKAGHTSGNIPYNSIALIPDIVHSAQLEVERIFANDRDGSPASLLAFLADVNVTTAQKKAVFIIPITRCTLDTTTKNITSIDLPATGNVYNYTVITPAPANVTHTIKVPILSNSTVTIRRKTVSNEPLVNWVAGSRLTSKQLNLATTQSLYLIQEALEKIGTSVTFETTQITVSSIAANSINSAALIDLAVTTGKIADLAVTTGKIADLAVTTGKIADNTVTTAKILDANVTTAKILDANVTTAKILDANVTTAKIADNAITTGKIADLTIVNEDISATAGIVDTKLATISTADKVANSATTAVTTATADTIVLRGSGGAVTTGPLTATTISTSGNLSFNSGYGSSVVGYGCRAWVNFTGVGTVSINASGNVSSITDNGAGDYTVNFSTSMPDINYCIATSGARISGEIQVIGVDYTNPTKTVSAVRLGAKTYAIGRTDSAECNVAIFR
jgi:hypothetical protein